MFWSGRFFALPPAVMRPSISRYISLGLPLRPNLRETIPSPVAAQFHGANALMQSLSSSSWNGCLRCGDWQDPACGAKRIDKL